MRNKDFVLGRSPPKNCKNDLTIKLDGNWSSFQLANNTPPLSVTGSVIAPSARMPPGDPTQPHQHSTASTPLFRKPGLLRNRWATKPVVAAGRFETAGLLRSIGGGVVPRPLVASQRSLHYAPIFRLLLKVAVKGTHQCDFNNFCGAFERQLEA